MSRLLVGSAALLLLAASPARAASGITSPGVDEVVTADAVLPLRAVVEAPAAGPSELSLLSPGATAAEVVAVSAGSGELAHDLDTSCATAGCTGRVPAANGTWTLRLSGAAEDERTFVLRIPPAAPLGVAADRSEAGVLVRWQQGDEPDLRGYRVEDADGRVVRDGIGLAACDAERSCSAEVPEAAGTWTVRAVRATCPDCAELLQSEPSAEVRAEGVTSPAPAAPAKAAPVQQQAFRGAFERAAPVVKVPVPVRRTARPVPPPAAGSYETQLGYDDGAKPRTPLARATDAAATLWTGDRLALLGVSVLMVAGALWLRRWARRPASD